MPTGPISFGPQQKTGQDELGQASPIAMNVCVDKQGTIRRRPGIQAYAGAPVTTVDASGVVALCEVASGVLYAVGNGAALKNVYQVTAGGAVDITTVSGIDLAGGRRPTIAETEAMIVLADGGPPVKVEFTAGQTTLLGGSPPPGSHVIANSSRLLMNDPVTQKGQAFFSGTAAGSSIAGHETWTIPTGGFFSAESRPDPIVALHENTNEVFAFGRTSMQYFAPDAQVTYAPVTTTENGCSAPYSIIKADQAFSWLDHQRRVVVSDGRSLSVLSDDIQQTLVDMGAVSDAYGYRFSSGPVECYVTTFPTDGRTFAYQAGGGWAQWGQYSGGNWSPFPVLCHFQRAVGAENLVGLTSGRICKLVNGVADDLGAPITASVTSGFESRGTLARKKTKRIRIALRRGETPAGPGLVGLLRWRDDLGPWSDSLPVYVGAPGDSAPVLEFSSIGWSYRMRQWQFEFSSTVTYSLVGVTEDFEVLST